MLLRIKLYDIVDYTRRGSRLISQIITFIANAWALTFNWRFYPKISARCKQMTIQM